MGRHEIRLRRQRMTSRRIEGHKNYYDVLKKHEKNSAGKKLIRIIIYIIIFLGLILLTYFSIQKFESIEATKPVNRQSKINSSTPVESINVSLKKENYGKA